MFRGTNHLNLDGKGRMAMPARYRELLSAHCGGRVIVTLNPDTKPDRSLLIYPFPEWERLEQQLTRLPSLKRQVIRLQELLLHNANECELDAQGRVLLPGSLRKRAALEKQVILIGQVNRFVLWDEPTWTRRQDALLDMELDWEELSSEHEGFHL